MQKIKKFTKGIGKGLFLIMYACIYGLVGWGVYLTMFALNRNEVYYNTWASYTIACLLYYITVAEYVK